MEDSPFKFNFLERPLSTLCNKDFKESLEKWFLSNRLKSWSFSFDQAYQHYMKDRFIKNFFEDDEVMSTIQQMAPGGEWGRVDKPSSIQINEIPCTVTSMTFFDKLKEEEIIRDNGNICKCFDEFYEGITISDELRKMLLLEDSDKFECYSDDERSEALFRLFFLFVVGGPVCQYEDNVQPYLDITKSLYKDLITVQKHPESKELLVMTKAYKVSTKNELERQVFPSTDDHEQTFAYLFIDPIKRHATLLYHCWGKGLW